jgi:hypothetical protein
LPILRRRGVRHPTLQGGEPRGLEHRIVEGVARVYSGLPVQASITVSRLVD